MGSGLRPVVLDHPLLFRFQIHVDGRAVGYARYRMDHDQLWLLETCIDPDCRGVNLEQVLIDGVLRSAHRRRIQVLPFCPLTRAYLSAHPQYAHLVPDAGRAAR